MNDMKLTVQDVYNLAEGLNGVLDKDDIPTKAAFRLQRNHSKIVDEFEVADKLRREIVDKYKEKEQENGLVKIKKDEFDQYKKEHDELMEQEIDIKLSYIYLHELGKTTKPRTLGLLEKILKVEEDKE